MIVYRQGKIVEEVQECLSWMVQDESICFDFLDSVLEQIEEKEFITQRQIDVINKILYDHGYEKMNLYTL